MNRDRLPKSSGDALPKSVKVRSTCNACQQAKIRCSHEKPSCRRCQRHKIECIYSMSRRLGRPAKKREPVHDTHSLSQESSMFPHHQANRRVRSPKKSKSKDEAALERDQGERYFQSTMEEMTLDKNPFEDSMLDNLSFEDVGLQAPSFMDSDQTSPFPASDIIDLSSDSWLQEFVPTQPSDMNSDCSLLQTMCVNNNAQPENVIPASQLDIHDVSTPIGAADPSTRLHTQPLLMDCYPTGNVLVANDEGSACVQAMPRLPSSTFMGHPMNEHPPWAQTLSCSVEAFPNRPSVESETLGFSSRDKAQRRMHEYNLPPDEHRVDPHILNAGGSRQYQCQCHEQAVQELMQMNLLVYRAGSTITIESILSCQRVLQQLAETVLRCGICSKTMVNLLMVVVVSIDSLVGTLERITSVENGLVEGVFHEQQDTQPQDSRPDGSRASKGRRQRETGNHFNMQVEACPLLVGGFCVPSDEKFSFVHRVLHARLSGLLGTVRRIKFCTQEMLAVSASQGKLIMIMETDRKLRLVMMKMKMLTG
ncbi:C6 zinc finger domain protein [Aspergillus steynii IBT 23096]|uniref:C6 zinc finger domain protein n=1 Tax=Aspergillus steynii IBT 23096 TaxID=1392250 RepID=A0A2I2GDQ6_9EURO|nr:C6 zinc finger domain protein [Aspergillus steynii IBT 23096]PLB51039.1 C6 zinc finger domain protein [Aspergillus steynii IBT 23096]